MTPFRPAKPRCDWGKVQDAYVPSVTFCHLKLQGGLDDSRKNLGYYEKGFWRQGQGYSLPFLLTSWDGRYQSPPPNGA